MAKKKRGRIVFKRTRTVSKPYTRPKNPEAGPSHHQPAESIPSGSGYGLPNQGSYLNSLEPHSATGTDSFVDNEPRLSGSEYGLPNQESYPDSPEPRSSTATNSFVDNVSGEVYRSDASVNIQRMPGARASLLESHTVPSCSLPATTANIEVVLANCRKRKSVQKSGDSGSRQDDAEDTTPKKRVKLETNISLPVSKILKKRVQFILPIPNIPKVTSTLVTSATTSSSDVFTFSPPIKIEAPVSIQSPSCSSEEEVQPKFTFSPAASITRRPPIYSSSNISVTTVISSATTSCSITVKTEILSKGSTSNAEEQVQPKFTFSPPTSIIRRPPIYSSSNISSTTVTSSAATSCSIPVKAGILSKGSTSKAKKRVQFEPSISLPIRKRPKVTFTLVTSTTTSSSDVLTFPPPVSIQSSSCNSTWQSSCFSMPITSTAPIESTETPQPIKSWTRPFKQSSRNTLKISPSTSSTPATHTPPESFRIGQETNTPPAPSQSPLFSSTFQPSCFSMPTTSTASIESTETTQPIKSWTRPFKQSSRNTLKNSPSTSSTPATYSPPEPFRIGQGTNTPPAPSQSPLFSSTFQPSFFSMPITSTASMKSWTRPFKQSSRNTFTNSPSTSSTPDTHTPPEPFRIGQGTNTPPASSKSSLFSSTLQSSSFAMGQDSAGTSQQPSPYSAASNLDQQSSSPSSTVPSKKQ